MRAVTSFFTTCQNGAVVATRGTWESCISEAGAGFFIKSFKTWWLELEKQNQGIGHSAMSACCKLQTLEWMYGVKLSSLYNVCAKYLVEVFKYPRTRNHIPTDAEDGYGSTPMIGLYGLVEPYSIMCITTMQSGVMTKDGKKKSTSKCYCSLCDYVVQNHPSINNHFRAHLHLSLLCTIDRCFYIEHSCQRHVASCWQGAWYTLCSRGSTTVKEVQEVEEVSRPSNTDSVWHLSSTCFQDPLGGCLPWMCHTPLVVPDTGLIGHIKALSRSFPISI